MAHGLPCRSGLFDNVDARVVPGKKGKCKLMFVFKEKIWPQMSSFAVEGASLIPPEQVAKVMATHEQGPTSVKTLAAIKSVVEGWCAPRSASPVGLMNFEGGSFSKPWGAFGNSYSHRLKRHLWHILSAALEAMGRVWDACCGR